MCRRLVRRLAAVLVLVSGPLCCLLLPPSSAAEEAKGVPQFRMQQIAKDLTVGYAVLLVDVNNDGKTDIVVVDSKRVVWYENPTWKMRNIIVGKTEPDNVCIAAADIDGDGQLDFALGAAWNPANTKSGGTLQWLKRGKTLDEPWSVYPIGEEPTLHRIRFADLDGNGKPVLLAVPLMGRDSTAAKNHMDGQPVRVLAYRIPKDPVRDRWPMEVLDESMHVIHNFQAIPPSPSPPAGGEGRVRGARGKGMDVLTASYEGVNLLSRAGEKWKHRQLGIGDQSNPKSNRGASEVKLGKLKNGRHFVATIEPWHGNKVVVYTPTYNRDKELWDRHVLDDKLKWGHAVCCADLDGDGNDELIIGVRDVLSDKPGENCGVRIFKMLDDSGGTKWKRHLLDEGGVRVEDLAVADLDGDGRLDIVAVGRQSHNARIYWNKATK